MENLQETVKNLPHEPGVYLYYNASDQVIYVGKAVDLSRRVKQYFQKDIHTDEKTQRLVSDIDAVRVIPTTSEFDALLLEASLIRKYLPKYNVVLRDDKSPLYAVITLAEELPRIVLVRKGEVSLYEKRKRNCIYGPFQSSYTLRALLRQLRSIVPYCTQKERRGKPCFYTHLGLCNPCPSRIMALTGQERKEGVSQYRKNIYRLRALFEGKTRLVTKQYEKEMRELADRQLFEQASQVRTRLRVLNSLSNYRYDPMIFLNRGAQDVYEEELTELTVALRPFYPTLTDITRIECFDISNFQGKLAVGSMVVLIHAKPEKGEYRKFRIKTVRGISDVAMMREVLTRRFSHTDWKFPDLVVVDGGKAQVAVAQEILKLYSLVIPCVGLSKREEEIIVSTKNEGLAILRLPLTGLGIKVVQRIRDEAHRFAITYHRELRERAFLEAF